VPEPRNALSPALLGYAHAAMDVSDGLIGDCDKLAGASGCSAVLHAEQVPLPAGLEQVRGDELAALLSGGEDFEILAAVPTENASAYEEAAAAAGVRVTQIGALTEGSSRTRLLLNGDEWPVGKRGYVHGRGGDG
jgi:thiamine-monophosphate kinase